MRFLFLAARYWLIVFPEFRSKLPVARLKPLATIFLLITDH